MAQLYPFFDDPLFNLKIHNKKEFNDYKYIGNVSDDIEGEFDKICSANFELTNHQIFVKNYMSSNTPYNSLLLYHGLGTGKTCSAISICEEVRRIYKQTGFNKRIIIVASSNVQDNFRKQLFDESKLIYDNNHWSIPHSCTGNTILNNVFPTQYSSLTKEKIVSSINKFIDSYYSFFGYIEFANYIKKIHLTMKNNTSHNDYNYDYDNALKREFSNRLIVIDEIHNMKNTNDRQATHNATYLKILIQNVRLLKFVFLTATPMFNNHKEILWLINLMHINDNRPQIRETHIFDEHGNFVVDRKTGEETGLHKFIDLTRGYVSYVRGENPYSFPFRIWPSSHSPDKSSFLLFKTSYPNFSPTGKPIPNELAIKFTDLYLSHIHPHSLQYNAYISLKRKLINSNKHLLKYDEITPLIQILNFSFPSIHYANHDAEHRDHHDLDNDGLYGSDGLLNVMNYNSNVFSYKANILTEFGPIFHPNFISSYSHKFKSIYDEISNTQGVILIYSQFIEGSIIPLALMLEEMGYKKFGNKSLLDTKYSYQGNVPTQKLTKSFKYIIISGNSNYSPNNEAEIAAAVHNDNANGDKIKVILISRAGSEGIDFKFIRQVHIIDPWYNLNRNEQIIGRAVRLCSHKLLPFNKRNVSIFFHTTILPNNEESVDLYTYRLAESKAIKIAKITRVLKQNAVDCMLNLKQTLFTQDNFSKDVPIQLSNNQIVQYKIGDTPFSLFCDFEPNCDYKCINNDDIHNMIRSDMVDLSTYNYSFLEYNSNIIIDKIKLFFFSHHVSSLINIFQYLNKYPEIVVQFSINKMINSRVIVFDKFNRPGTLSLIGEYIIFVPNHIDHNSTLFDQSTPLNFKHDKLVFKFKEEFQKPKKSLKITTKEQHEATPGTTLGSTLNTTLGDTLGDTSTIVNDVVQLFNLSFDTAHHSNPKYETLIKDSLKSDSSDSWYKASNFVTKFLQEHGFKIELIQQCICAHIIDHLAIEKKIIFFNYLYQSHDSLSPTLHLFFNYVHYRSFDFLQTRAIILQKDNIASLLYVYDDNTKTWNIGLHSDIKHFKTNLAFLSRQHIDSLMKQTNTLGFIEQKNNQMLFKLKDLGDTLNRGYRCEQAKLHSVRKLSSDLLLLWNINSDLFTKHKRELNCILIEILLRSASIDKIQGYIWFIDSFDFVTISTFLQILQKTSTLK